MKKSKLIVLMLIVAGCAAQKTDITPKAGFEESVSKETDNTSLENTDGFSSKDFSRFFKAYDDERYEELISLLDQYEKEDSTGNFAKQKLEMRIRAELSLQSNKNSDVNLGQYSSKYIGKFIEINGKASGDVMKNDSGEYRPIEISEDSKSVTLSKKLTSKKHRSFEINYAASLSDSGLHELKNGYYYICDGEISRISVDTDLENMHVNVEVSNAILSIDPNI